MFIKFREIVRFVVRHLGLSIASLTVLVIAIRGFDPISNVAAIIISISICVPMVIFIVLCMDDDRSVNPLVKRLAENDVVISLTLVIIYVGIATGSYAII